MAVFSEKHWCDALAGISIAHSHMLKRPMYQEVFVSLRLLAEDHAEALTIVAAPAFIASAPERGCR